MPLISMEKAERKCKAEEMDFWEAVRLWDAIEQDITTEDSWKEMEKMWQAMLDSLHSYDPNLTSGSGLVGKEGGQMQSYLEKGDTLCGDFMSKVIANALKMGCNNACMKRIVAAPTAGSCGVLPAVLVTYYEECGAPWDTMVQSLYVAAGIGQIIGSRAYLAGASGGCQAEIGAASGMAASAICHVKGGGISEIENACALALKNLLGLVCDPVAGLVEIPCVKRNVVGAMNALSSADMALAGIESKVPLDQVIDAMKEVGDDMNPNLKETGSGGLAATPWAVQVKEDLHM